MGRSVQPVNDRGYKTDEKGMLQLPKEMQKGRYWMVESTTPNKGETGKTQYQDNMALYMVDVEDEILFLYEKDPQTRTSGSLLRIDMWSIIRTKEE